MMNKILICFVLVCIGGSKGLPQSVPPIFSAKEIIIQPLSVLNSPAKEANVALAPDKKSLYFMSERGHQPWSTRRDEKDSITHDGDIWIAHKEKGQWQKPSCLPAKINTGSGEDEPSFSADGLTLYFQSWDFGWENDGGPYYFTTLNGLSMTKPTGLGGGVNKFFKQRGFYGTDGMCVSPNGKFLIFASAYHYTMPMDLYISYKTTKGWSFPVPIQGVNTEGDERAIFIAADNRTLYFASNGRKGLGGMDLYTAKIASNASVGNITALKEPFNSSENEQGFFIPPSGEEAFLIRNGNIYHAYIKPPTPAPRQNSPPKSRK